MDDDRIAQIVTQAAAAILSGEDLTTFAARLDAHGGPSVQAIHGWVQQALVCHLEQSTLPVGDLPADGGTALDRLVVKAGRLLYGRIRGDEPTGTLGEFWASPEAAPYRELVLNVVLR